MKRSRFSEEQIVKILKAAETGVPVDELLRAQVVEHPAILRRSNI